jgi:hypothetical protein
MHISRQKSITPRSIKTTGALIVIMVSYADLQVVYSFNEGQSLIVYSK